jgi:3-methyladenine DNA glycosylase AlkC
MRIETKIKIATDTLRMMRENLRAEVARNNKDSVENILDDIKKQEAKIYRYWNMDKDGKWTN